MRKGIIYMGKEKDSFKKAYEALNTLFVEAIFALPTEEEIQQGLDVVMERHAAHRRRDER